LNLPLHGFFIKFNLLAGSKFGGELKK